MIIYIDKSIAEHGNFTDNEEVMFNELACAHRRGICYLCGAPESIDRLKKEWSIFRKGIDTQYAEIGTLFNVVDTLLVISYYASPILPKIIQNKLSQDRKSVRVISVDQAIDYRLNRQCILLGESLYDCDFYRLITEYYLHSQQNAIRGISLSLVDEIGGGDSTNKALEKCVRKNHNLTFCLTDSDKKYDKSQKYGAEPSQGKTARSLIKSETELIKEGFRQLFELYCLDVHEAENLIPFSILDDVAKNTIPQMLPGINYLRKLKAANLSDAILYYDFKKGNNIAKLRNECQNEDNKNKPKLAYWEEIAQCIEDESAPCLSENILNKAIECMKKPGYIASEMFELDDYLVDIWHVIGKKVFSWGCANRPNAANPSCC